MNVELGLCPRNSFSENIFEFSVLVLCSVPSCPIQKSHETFPNG
jgi:hypothetical protein